MKRRKTSKRGKRRERKRNEETKNEQARKKKRERFAYNVAEEGGSISWIWS
jgi:hypothetical protein